MGVLGTGPAAGVAQTALTAQQTARAQQKQEAERIRQAQRMREILEARLEGVEEDESAPDHAELYVDGDVSLEESRRNPRTGEVPQRPPSDGDSEQGSLDVEA